MLKYLRLIVCLFVMFTLVTSVSCKKKEEAAPAPTEEVGSIGEAPPTQGEHP